MRILLRDKNTGRFFTHLELDCEQTAWAEREAFKAGKSVGQFLADELRALFAASKAA